MTQSADRPIKGLRTTSLGTLVSRLLGLARDIATAALLGMTASMDALVLAFRLPDLFRRFFGEGVLTASYVPVIAQKRLQDGEGFWRLTATTMVALAGLVSAIVLLLEILLWSSSALFSGGMTTQLTSIVLPYIIFICLTAQLASTLQTCGKFAAPALAPIAINVIWLVTVLWIAPAFAADDKPAQVRIIAVALLLGGVLQFATQLWAVRRLGFRMLVSFSACATDLRRVARRLLPAMVGLAAIQINTFIDTLYAWYLTSIRSVLEQGTVTATYFAERMYMFPVGMIGVAVATASYPRMSELAAMGKHDELRRRLTLGTQLNTFLAIPASAGMILLSESITRVLFEHGEFGPASSPRLARVIVGYGFGLWSFCTLPLLVRVFYATGNFRLPAVVGAASILLNVAANVLLVPFMQEAGLGLATALAATLQMVALLFLMARRNLGPNLRPLLVTLAKSAVAAAAMILAIQTVRPWVAEYVPNGQLIVLILAGIVVYGTISWFWQRALLGQLLRRGK